MGASCPLVRGHATPCNTRPGPFFPWTKEHIMAAPKTEPESPDEFDFGAWLTGASAPEREVTVYAANALRGDIARLEQERADAKARAAAGGSWGDPGGTDLDGIEKRLAEARRKLAASGLVFRVRSLDSEDGDRIRRQYPEKKGATDDEQVDVYNARFLEQMAAQIFHPKKFTVSELKQLRAAVGEPEFGKLFEACQEVTSRTAASSPFSPAASGMNLS